MKILVINSGSSSIKFQLIDMPIKHRLVIGIIEKIGENSSLFKMKYEKKAIKHEIKLENHAEALRYLINQFNENHVISDLDEIVACGHRVAHGGEYFDSSVIIDDEVAKKIESLSCLAPLHNPNNLKGYIELKKVLKKAIHVAVFDTSFHQTISKDVFIYPIPYKYYENYKIRKYGFHGTSHKFVSSRARELLKPENSKRLIVCHLGNGASIAAIKDGKCINTSMGLTPLGGIMMGTRSGNIDPTIIEFICAKEHKSVKDVLNELNKESGMLGISCVSNDAREINKKAISGHDNSILSLDVYARRIADYIGAYFMHLGGLDALVFTAGIGENSAYLREKIVDCIKESLGIELDNHLNNSTIGVENIISTSTSKVKVLVIPTDEEMMIAQDSYELLNK